MPAAGARLGIDFGTSHTVAVVRRPDGQARPLLFDGTPLLPSAVLADTGGTMLVGRDALHGGRITPDRLEPNPKRRIDEQEVLLGPAAVAVRDLFATVFERVLTEFRRTSGNRPPAEVVITYPAEWAATRRTILNDAAHQSGLPRPWLVPEPVAAAGYFTRSLRHQLPIGSAVVVYDLGAGTFDASVVSPLPGGGFDVRAVRGRDDIGGLDLDEIVVQLIGAACPPDGWHRLTAPSTVEEKRALRALRDEAREAKERLSRVAGVTVAVPLLGVDVVITREELEARAAVIIEQTVRVTEDVMHQADVSLAQLAGVFLVGGGSRMPLVATMLHRHFGRAPVTIEQPETVVAEGSVLLDPPPAPVAAPVSPPPRPVSPPLPVSLPPPRRFPVAAAMPMPMYVMPPPRVLVPLAPQYRPRERSPWQAKVPAITLMLIGLGWLVATALGGYSVVHGIHDTMARANSAVYLAIAWVFLVVWALYGIFCLRAGIRVLRGGRRNLASSIVFALFLPLQILAFTNVAAVVAAAVVALGVIVLVLFPASRAWIRAHAYPLRETFTED
jgi:actin-like ATPase involved in cell morphogenesis